MQPDIALDVRDLRKSFAGLDVLRGISFDVRSGEVVVIVGPSGAGKSTILRCLIGLTPFEGGTIAVQGSVITGAEEPTHDSRRNRESAQAIRQRVGMVFQQFNLFPHLTVAQNIALAPAKTGRLPAKAAKDEARRLLDQVGLLEKADEFPRKLSGGQQQRVAICRALAMKPEVLLFDEVTSMLDPELVGEVLGVMRELARGGMTMVVVTHEMTFARDVGDRLIVIADGSILEQGPPAEVLERPVHARTKAFLRRFSGS